MNGVDTFEVRAGQAFYGSIYRTLSALHARGDVLLVNSWSGRTTAGFVVISDMTAGQLGDHIRRDAGMGRSPSLSIKSR